jgi:predicted nucleotidyltransferase
MDNNKILNILKDRIAKKFGSIVENLILFGSRTKGSAMEYSDYDILIILNSSYNWELERKIYDLCYELDLEYDIIIDVKLISMDELQTIRGKQPYIQHAIESGLQI